MKTKYLSALVLIVMLSSFTNKNVHQKFNFQKWRSQLFVDFDNLSKKEFAKPENANFKKSMEIANQHIRENINYVEEKDFMEVLDTVLQKNEIKNWEKMYYIYQFREGEVIVANSIFVFFNGDKCWATGYVNTLPGGFHPAGQTTEAKLKQIKSYFGNYETTFFIVSEFDQNFNCLSNKFVIEGSWENEGYPGIQELDIK